MSEWAAESRSIRRSRMATANALNGGFLHAFGMRGLNEIPTITVQIDEDGNSAIQLLPWLLREDDAFRAIIGVVTCEIVRLKKKKHTTSALLANNRALSIIGRSCEEKRTAAAAWRNDDPPFFSGELRVLCYLETKLPGVERDRFVIVFHEQCREHQTLHEF
jgi:hypothetical protein